MKTDIMERNWEEDWELVQKRSKVAWYAMRWEVPTDDQFCIEDEDGVDILTVWRGELPDEQVRNNTLFCALAHEALPYWMQKYKDEKARADAAEEQKEQFRKVLLGRAVGTAFAEDDEDDL
ncbi:hypothetical protein M5W76_12240 [Paenibacillus larvae]|uniref:Uncharacterized protein n=1 Tax=Paenibacillus phage PBL1c TaxID=2070194 RepID=A0A2I7SCB6_9CAUD|nr:hypothetical protein [Paenibacillus larvae]YP_009836396.1 hypothetical protein HWB44_gp66 [Paenibacillus phage PBL1c]AUS03534.1 hypothetical protein PBL1C_66 [Paenibacillus phage PBL1c]MCY9719258.1 hypothetical protein [Paenibacillus larvae]